MEPEQPVLVDQTTISCDGGGGALGHPLVYLKFGSADDNGEGEIVCPYCSARFILDREAAQPVGH
ncbi:MAG TPA: zinc-finger domain-containing protein [Rhodospirillales bacterium]|nr:zinc-finger domain-containing protein [Rhodospirillales bacterium]